MRVGKKYVEAFKSVRIMRWVLGLKNDRKSNNYFKRWDLK
jgi:hypothetical protein